MTDFSRRNFFKTASLPLGLSGLAAAAATALGAAAAAWFLYLEEWLNPPPPPVAAAKPAAAPAKPGPKTPPVRRGRRKP